MMVENGEKTKLEIHLWRSSDFLCASYARTKVVPRIISSLEFLRAIFN